MAATIRSLASACGVSTATVSRALAGHPTVDPATLRRIKEEAQRQGYRRNDLVAALMAHTRRSRSQVFVGNLAIIHVPSPGQTGPGPQQRQIIQGAEDRAKDLGYRLYAFSLATPRLRLPALVRMLHARGVAGVILLHSRPGEAPLDFPWNDFAALDVDYSCPAPLLHTVILDHFATMTAALKRLRAAGCRRAGLFLERPKDERINFHWSAAFRSFQERHGGIGSVPPLIAETMSAGAFLAWFGQHRPDVVVGHFGSCIEWLATLRLRVPEDVGFFSLNRVAEQRPCAGVDPRLKAQGSAAIDALTGQLQRGERGLPPLPHTILVPGGIILEETV